MATIDSKNTPSSFPLLALASVFVGQTAAAQGPQQTTAADSYEQIFNRVSTADTKAADFDPARFIADVLKLKDASRDDCPKVAALPAQKIMSDLETILKGNQDHVLAALKAKVGINTNLLQCGMKFIP